MLAECTRKTFFSLNATYWNSFSTSFCHPNLFSFYVFLFVSNRLSGYKQPESDFIYISPSCKNPYSEINCYILRSMCVYDGVCSCVRERTREQRAQKKKKKGECLLVDLWRRIGNQYDSFKSFRCTDWYLQWWAYGPGTRAASLTVPIWVTLSARETSTSIVCAQVD